MRFTRYKGIAALAVVFLILLCQAQGQKILLEKQIDESLNPIDLYYRSFNEINGYILKILKENGKGDGNLVVLEYVDLKELGFLRREKFNLQYFTNDFEKVWEVRLDPETYLSVPKPFYQITANKNSIYFFESGTLAENAAQSCKLTQFNYEGQLVNTSKNEVINFHVFSTYTSQNGLHYVGHRFTRGPEYYLGLFQKNTLLHSIKSITLPHEKYEVNNWVINKSEFEFVPGASVNNYTWLKKTYILQPMSENQAIKSEYIKIDANGKITNTLKVDFSPQYRNYLGIDTELFEELGIMSTIVLKGAKTGPFFDVYLKDFTNQELLHKEIHFYDLRKELREDYRYYDYHEIDYNHYRNVDHFKAVIFEPLNERYILIDKVPDGTYFFYMTKSFDLIRVDYAKEFSGNSQGSSMYNFGIINGFSNVYTKEGFEHQKSAIDVIMEHKREDPRNYYYTVLNRKNYQILIIDNSKTLTTTAYKIAK